MSDPFDLAARFAVEETADRGDSAVGNSVDSEAAYICDACGEEIVVPADVAAGSHQEYVEDCPVCCRPNVLTVFVGPHGEVSCTARPE
ncbi:MAG: CPXCG motif-containing cysteine-rich protein [Planctomycetota bacterium]